MFTRLGASPSLFVCLFRFLFFFVLVTSLDYVGKIDKKLDRFSNIVDKIELCSFQKFQKKCEEKMRRKKDEKKGGGNGKKRGETLSVRTALRSLTRRMRLLLGLFLGTWAMADRHCQVKVS